ncbi:MAG: MarR family winged helix-turn-helix transcriptional regulator [Anaerovoracaceae bacterium]|jgi:DNA-binding MarR family transcriptional regulator
MGKHSIFGTTSILYRCSKKYFTRGEEILRFRECHPPYLMAVAENEGCDQETIANYTHINKGRVAKVLSGLEDLGYIRREHPEGDRRRNLIYLTDKGRETIPRLHKFEDDFNEIITRGMSDEQKEDFMALLSIAAFNALTEMDVCPPPQLEQALAEDVRKMSGRAAAGSAAGAGKEDAE